MLIVLDTALNILSTYVTKYTKKFPTRVKITYFTVKNCMCDYVQVNFLTFNPAVFLYLFFFFSYLPTGTKLNF